MNEKPTIIKELAENELKVSNLYKGYAEMFPDMKNFWLKNAEEEVKHYKMLLDLTEKETNGQLFIDERRFKPEAVRLTRKYIEENVSRKNPTVMDALIVSENIENSLLEKNVFEIFESDAPELKNALKVLQEETQEHLRAIQEKVKEIIPKRTY